MYKAADLEKTLIEKGYKLTKNRRYLLDALCQNTAWTSAQTLYESVIKRNPGVNFSTIYRNLDTLTDMGILCRIYRNDGINYYSINHQDEHHHHLICKSCGQVFTLDYCPLNTMDLEELRQFSQVECKFEVYGYCTVCQALQCDRRKTENNNESGGFNDV